MPIVSVAARPGCEKPVLCSSEENQGRTNWTQIVEKFTRSDAGCHPYQRSKRADPCEGFPLRRRYEGKPRWKTSPSCDRDFEVAAWAPCYYSTVDWQAFEQAVSACASHQRAFSSFARSGGRIGRSFSRDEHNTPKRLGPNHPSPRMGSGPLSPQRCRQPDGYAPHTFRRRPTLCVGAAVLAIGL